MCGIAEFVDIPPGAGHEFVDRPLPGADAALVRPWPDGETFPRAPDEACFP